MAGLLSVSAYGQTPITSFIRGAIPAAGSYMLTTTLTNAIDLNTNTSTYLSVGTSALATIIDHYYLGGNTDKNKKTRKIGNFCWEATGGTIGLVSIYIIDKIKSKKAVETLPLPS